jgi:beta-fructofuranosidase
MHWGHLTSPDLVYWKEHDIAIFPSKPYDQNGCFSGTSIEINNRMYVYYTGVCYIKADPENIHRLLNDELISEQVCIWSDDGYFFDNFRDKRIIISHLDDIRFGSYNRTRDPRIWKNWDYYYLSLGSQYLEKDGGRFIGEILFYKSSDGLNWNYINRFSDPKIGNMWECPILFEDNSQYLLIMSAMNAALNDAYPDQSFCMSVDFDQETCSVIKKGNPYPIDYGGDLYAPHNFKDKNGKSVMMGWMRMPLPFEGENWIGMMSLPREITLKKGHLFCSVISEIREQFKTSILPEKWNGNPSIVQVSFLGDGSINIGGYVIICNNASILFDRTAVFLQDRSIEKWTKTFVLRPEGICRLEIFVDNGIVETFINDGVSCVSHILYHMGTSISTLGSAKITGVFIKT